jgi:hypothetical protein
MHGKNHFFFILKMSKWLWTLLLQQADIKYCAPGLLDQRSLIKRYKGNLENLVQERGGHDKRKNFN